MTGLCLPLHRVPGGYQLPGGSPRNGQARRHPSGTV